MKKRISLLLILLFGIFLSSCGGKPSPSTTITSNTTSVDDSKLNFTGVTFDSESFVYDGNPHILSEVSGAPENTTISYSGRNSYVDVGVYEASATLSKNGYNDLTLTATLTITKATLSGYEYESKTVTYDGLDHINDIQLIGVLPEGSTVKETVKNSNNEIVTSAIEVGSYTYTCEITNKNYNAITLRATLDIKAKKKDMPVFISSDGTIYFANGLHESFLYSLNSSEELKLLDYSSPKEFNKYNSSSALFISGSVLLNSVKEISNGETNILYTDSNISDFVKYNSSIYYYSCNSLNKEKSGIYKVDATDTANEPIVTKIFEGKTDNLSIYENHLYFTNGNDKNYIYKLNLSSNQTTLVLQEKVHEYTISNNRLYCTVNGTLNDYIGYVDLSSSSTTPTKLTNASGEYLTVKNGYLYYNYTDLFSYVDSSYKGVWRISTSGGEPEQIIATENINGFDVESSTSIVYIDTIDLHLYRYNVTTKTKTDLLNGFVAPEVTPMNTGGNAISLGTKTYYLNMYAGKTLYVYDELTKKNSQLTSNKVADFYIYNNIMYFNQVTMLTNNDLYSINLKTGGEAEKISSNDIRNMVSDGTYIYATHYNWAGLAGGISRMKLDGSEYVKFSNVDGAKNFTIKDNKLYYINCATGQDNGNIEFMSISDITSLTEGLKGTVLSSNIKNVKQFAFDGNNIFYIYNGTIDNSVRRTDFTSLAEGTKIASSKTNPSEILLHGDYVYYYSYAATAASSAGFYKVSKTATQDGTQELILGYNSTYYGSSLVISSSGYLYFLNYIPKLLLGDAHFYQLDLSSKNVVKIY